ncbi:MAG: hypothetical protein WCG97_00695 [bacterium]
MKTNHWPLIIGISIPILFIIIISIIIFTPNLYIKPAHNFLYTTLGEENYYGSGQIYKNTYAVENERLVLRPGVLQEKQTYKADFLPLYLYDVTTDSSHQVTYEDEKNLALDPGPTSPDGYSVSWEYNHDGIFELFGSDGSKNGYFIEKGKGKKQLTGLNSSNGYYYQGNFKLIGWVK